jgi:hypothetical protein
MEIVFGIAGLLVVAVFVAGVRRAIRGARTSSSRGVSRTGPHAATDRRAGVEAGGSLVGQQRHDILADDSLPGGHPGSAADFAYWSALFDDDEDDDRPVY